MGHSCAMSAELIFGGATALVLFVLVLAAMIHYAQKDPVR